MNKHTKRFLLKSTLFIVLPVLLFLAGSFSQEHADKQEDIITFTNDQVHLINELQKATYPYEFVVCLDVNKDNLVQDYYFPTIYNSSQESVNFETCRTNTDIHNHNNGNNKLSEIDKSHINENSYRCLWYDYNKISCYQLKEMGVDFVD